MQDVCTWFVGAVSMRRVLFLQVLGSSHRQTSFHLQCRARRTILGSGREGLVMEVRNEKLVVLSLVLSLTVTISIAASAYGPVSFSPDGKTLASGSGGKTIKLWDTATGKEIRTLAGHSEWLQSVCFSPDGKTLANGSGDKTDQAAGMLPRANEIRTLVGTRVVSILSVSAPTERPGKREQGQDDQALGCCHRQGDQDARRDMLDGVYSVCFSPDGKTLASGSDDQTIKLWDIATGMEIRTLAERFWGVSSVSFSPDGKILASGSR